MYRNKKTSQLKLGLSLKTKHEGMDHDNLFGIGIPDIFMNILSCHGLHDALPILPRKEQSM